MGGIQKTGHLLRSFAFDAHGQAKRANLQVGHRAVQHLAKQIGGLLARQRAGAVFAASDFLDVFANGHRGLCVCQSGSGLELGQVLGRKIALQVVHAVLQPGLGELAQHARCFSGSGIKAHHRVNHRRSRIVGHVDGLQLSAIQIQHGTQPVHPQREFDPRPTFQRHLQHDELACAVRRWLAVWVMLLALSSTTLRRSSTG